MKQRYEAPQAFAPDISDLTYIKDLLIILNTAIAFLFISDIISPFIIIRFDTSSLSLDDVMITLPVYMHRFSSLSEDKISAAFVVSGFHNNVLI